MLFEPLLGRWGLAFWNGGALHPLAYAFISSKVPERELQQKSLQVKKKKKKKGNRDLTDLNSWGWLPRHQIPLAHMSFMSGRSRHITTTATTSTTSSQRGESHSMFTCCTNSCFFLAEAASGLFVTMACPRRLTTAATLCTRGPSHVVNPRNVLRPQQIDGSRYLKRARR